MGDISYFTKNKMLGKAYLRGPQSIENPSAADGTGAGHIDIFVNKLPSKLKRKFLEFVNNGEEFSEDLQRLGGKILQDFEREDMTGLVKIRFWHGCSKVINAVPLVGQIWFGVARMAQDTSWKELYFDRKTGELLSSTQFNAACKLNDIGREHLNNRNYETAIEYFHNAYFNNHGSSRNDAIYLTNKAIALYSLEQYDKTLAEANKALEKDSSYQSAREQKKKAEYAITQNMEARDLNQKGCDHYAKKEYQIALSKFHDAYMKCVGKKNEAVYLSNKALALNCLERYQEAHNNATKALEIDPNYEQAKDEKIKAEAGIKGKKEDEKTNTYKETPILTYEYSARNISTNFDISNKKAIYDALVKITLATIITSGMIATYGIYYGLNGIYRIGRNGFDLIYRNRADINYGLNGIYRIGRNGFDLIYRNRADIKEVSTKSVQVTSSLLYSGVTTSWSYTKAFFKSSFKIAKEIYITKRFDKYILYKDLNQLSIDYLKQSIAELRSLIDSGSNKTGVLKRLQIAELKLKRINLKNKLTEYEKGTLEISNLLKEMANLIDAEIKIYNDMNLADQILHAELKQLEEELLENQKLNRNNDNNKVTKRNKRVNLNDLVERIDKATGKLEKEIVKETLSRDVHTERS
jgi:tetratricopeptide (TPR) repeat protein